MNCTNGKEGKEEEKRRGGTWAKECVRVKGCRKKMACKKRKETHSLCQCVLQPQLL